MNKEKIIITGAGGAIGRHLIRKAPPESIGIVRSRVDQERVFIHDLTQPLACDLFRDGYQTVFHLAAKTHIDNCETDRDEAELGQTWKDNVLSTKNLIDYCRETSKRLVYLSTECVFDGEKGTPYTEEDFASPKNWYGHTKRVAEELIINSGLEYLIVRSVVVYGLEDESDILGKIASRLADGNEMLGVSDQLFNPTFVDDLVDGLLELERLRATGIYHIAGSTILTPYQFTIKIAEYLGLDTSKVTPVTLTQYLGEKKAALRLRNATLEHNKFTSETQTYPKTVEEGITTHFKRSSWASE